MNIMERKWLNRFMAIAEEVKTWSKDPKCQVGAVVVSPDGRQVSWGYNGLPRNIKPYDERQYLQRDESRLLLTIHAEANAMMNAPTDIRGWYLFVTKFPCIHCTKQILQQGISLVVAPPIDPKSKWADEQYLARRLIQDAEGIDIFELGVEP